MSGNREHQGKSYWEPATDDDNEHYNDDRKYSHHDPIRSCYHLRQGYVCVFLSKLWVPADIYQSLRKSGEG